MPEFDLTVKHWNVADSVLLLLKPCRPILMFLQLRGLGFDPAEIQ